MTNEATQTDFLPQRLKADRLDPLSLKKELLLRHQLAEWRFFPPPEDIVREILRLSDKLVDNHLDYETAQEEDLELEGEEINELADKNPSWFREVFNEVSEILFHGSKESQRDDFENGTESISYYQSLVGERIYNHLARLCRSSYARRGGSFSIREELTDEIAGKIGMGLYLRLDQNDELRQECNRVLFYLALSFQNWLIERKEVYVAPWGIICTPDTSETQPHLHGQPRLIMTPDVKEFVVGTMGSAVQAG